MWELPACCCCKKARSKGRWRWLHGGAKIHVWLLWRGGYLNLHPFEFLLRKHHFLKYFCLYFTTVTALFQEDLVSSERNKQSHSRLNKSRGPCISLADYPYKPDRGLLMPLQLVGGCRSKSLGGCSSSFPSHNYLIHRVPKDETSCLNYLSSSGKHPFRFWRHQRKEV